MAGGVSGPCLGVPHPGIAASPHLPQFCPHPSPGCLGVQLQRDGDQMGVQRGIGQERALNLPHYVFQCVLSCGLQGHRRGHLG